MEQICAYKNYDINYIKQHKNTECKVANNSSHTI